MIPRLMPRSYRRWTKARHESGGLFFCAVCVRDGSSSGEPAAALASSPVLTLHRLLMELGVRVGWSSLVKRLAAPIELVPVNLEVLEAVSSILAP